MLKYKCTNAVRFAPLFAPIAEIIAVTQVPMFCPRRIGIAVPNVNPPVTESACKIPTDAEELWMTAVSSAPASTPSTGFLNMVSRFVNSGTSASGSTAPLIADIPYISTTNPSRISPVIFFLSLLPDISRIIPIIARIGENDVGFNIFIKRLSP